MITDSSPKLNVEQDDGTSEPKEGAEEPVREKATAAGSGDENRGAYLYLIGVM